MPIRLPAAAVRALGIRVPDPKPRAVRLPTRDDWATGLNTQLRAIGARQGRPEFRVHPARKLAYDLGFEAHSLVVDVDGGAWLPGGGHSHSRGSNFERDRRKDALALVMGYRVLRLTPRMVKDGTGAILIAHLLAHRSTRSMLPITKDLASILKIPATA